MRRIAFILTAAVLALMLLAVVRRADRQPHPDETEYLHAAWLMKNGETLYVTFFEHHPPFLFAAFRLIAGDDVLPYFVRARLLSGAFALIALVAYAAIVWRVRAEATPIALGLIFAALPMWLLGMTAARAEPFALAFFWCGVALIVLPRGDARFISLAGGAGLALVAIAGLWSPKWPLSSIVVAGFWWWRTPRRLLSAAVAGAITAAAIAMLALLAPLDRIWFFVVEFNRALWSYLSQAHAAHLAALRPDAPVFRAAGLLGPVVAAIVFVIVAAGVSVRGERLREKHLVVFFLLLAFAASLELRFAFPYPLLWEHYFLMWTFAFAALAGFVPAAVEALLARVSFAGARLIGVVVTCASFLIIGVNLWALAPVHSGGDDGPYWQSVRYLKQRLEPHEEVWIGINRHPVAARDATYYWWGYDPYTLIRTPRSARYLPPADDLPFCAIARGEPSSIRFISSPRVFGASPEQRRCFEQLLAADRIRKTPMAEVFEIAR